MSTHNLRGGGTAGSVLAQGRYWIWSLAAWLLLALAFAGQAYVFAQYRGLAQPWWPSFLYTLAIFSVLAVFTPPLVLATAKGVRSGAPLHGKLLLVIAGLPLLMAAHLFCFVLLFWPAYGGGRFHSYWAMAERVLAANLHVYGLAYGAIVIGTILTMRLRANRTDGCRPAQDTAPPADMLYVRSKGSVRLLPADEVDWFAAAGNYAEAHGPTGTFLLNDPLSVLEKRLPAGRFVRIHRRTIIRLGAVDQLRTLGRGDALVMMRSGAELRLSRRFRKALIGALGLIESVPLITLKVPPVDRPPPFADRPL